jgi:hypothetical protein
MSPEYIKKDIKKLLGGYASGTLTDTEQQALFAAALEDQELFDALAGEQPLRDLLSDPAARAELLSALDTRDTPSRLGGFWQWLRRPAVAGLATAGVATIAVVAVWQGTRVPSAKTPAPTIVAELRSPPVPVQRPPAQPPAEIPPPAGQQGAGKRSNVAQLPPPAVTVDKSPPPAGPPATPPPGGLRSGMTALVVRKDETALEAAEKKAPSPPPVPAAAAAAPALMARKAKAEVELSATTGQLAGAISGGVPQTALLDARTLFYANQTAQGANSFVPSGVGGVGGAPLPPAPQADAAARTAKTVAGLVEPLAAAVPRLGVRVSILRGASEVDLTTVLDPGEAVRLKLIPNADGFLYVVEGARLVASGAALRLKPFETPELRLQGSGQKQLYLVLSRSPRTVDPSSLGTLARGDLVETSASQDRATYFVSSAPAPQLVVPVTLTWR